jgi:hypothetical protein
MVHYMASHCCLKDSGFRRYYHKSVVIYSFAVNVTYMNQDGFDPTCIRISIAQVRLECGVSTVNVVVMIFGAYVCIVGMCKA